MLSVDPAGVFRTSPRAHDLAPEQRAVIMREMGFVSSNRWDVAGTAAYGFTSIWVSRSGQPDEYPNLAPVREIGRLDAFLD